MEREVRRDEVNDERDRENSTTIPSYTLPLIALLHTSSLPSSQRPFYNPLSISPTAPPLSARPCAEHPTPLYKHAHLFHNITEESSIVGHYEPSTVLVRIACSLRPQACLCSLSRAVGRTEFPWPLGALHRQIEPLGAPLALALEDDLLCLPVLIARLGSGHSRARDAAPLVAHGEIAEHTAIAWKLVSHVMARGKKLQSWGQILRRGDQRACATRIHRGSGQGAQNHASGSETATAPSCITRACVVARDNDGLTRMARKAYGSLGVLGLLGRDGSDCKDG